MFLDQVPRVGVPTLPRLEITVRIADHGSDETVGFPAAYRLQRRRIRVAFVGGHGTHGSVRAHTAREIRWDWDCPPDILSDPKVARNVGGLSGVHDQKIRGP